MRKILLLITDLHVGGTPTVVRELAIRLSAMMDVHVEVACLSTWGRVADQISNARVRVTAFDAGGILHYPMVVRKLVRLIRTRGIDTVLSFLIHANLVAASARPFCPTVRWFQSIQTTQPFPRWHWRLQAIVQHAAERIIVPSVSVSAAAHDWSAIPFEKISVISNAIDVAAFNPPMPPTGNAAHDPGAKPTFHQRPACTRLGFIGRLDPIKRIPDLLEAMCLLDPSFHLNIFGEGDERQHIENTIRRLALGARVVMYGAVANPQQALAQMDLLILPSSAEGFGLVLIEAMAWGLPIVATDAPGIRDVVQHGLTGVLVPVGSPSQLANAVETVLGDGDYRDALVKRARAEACDRYSWETVLPQYLKLLEILPIQ